MAHREKLPAQNLWQLLPGEWRRVDEQRQVLQSKGTNVSYSFFKPLTFTTCTRDTISINTTEWMCFIMQLNRSLPLVHRWTACCTTWQRPRHWRPDWYWRSQPEAGSWPGPTQEEETIQWLTAALIVPSLQPVISEVQQQSRRKLKCLWL